MIRQGDVFLKKIDKKFKGGKKGKAVLALGEVSGHSHRMDGVRFCNDSQALAELIEVPAQGSELIHEEHDAVVVPKGVYKVIRQREYDVVEGTRQVMD
jgi:hypothetical protein